MGDAESVVAPAACDADAAVGIDAEATLDVDNTIDVTTTPATIEISSSTPAIHEPPSSKGAAAAGDSWAPDRPQIPPPRIARRPPLVKGAKRWCVDSDIAADSTTAIDTIASLVIDATFDATRTSAIHEPPLSKGAAAAGDSWAPDRPRIPPPRVARRPPLAKGAKR